MEQILNITSVVQPYLTLLPDHETVFAPESSFLSKHLLPLVSIDLSVVNPEWQGKVHLVNPIEPHDSYIGSYTHEFHNEYANENWFILKLDENNKYQWLGRKEYFYAENPDAHNEVKSHSAEMHKDYLSLKKRFKETGYVISTTSVKYNNSASVTILDQLGGEVDIGNWTYPIDQHFDLRYINENTDKEIVNIYNHEGQRFHFIAGVAGWEYCNHGADWILMFYQPETRSVLFTFDWT